FDDRQQDLKYVILKEHQQVQKGNDKVIYQSSNKSIITVDSKGMIAAKKKGKASITVKSGNVSAKISVVVK
ncbi:MAG: Ig-like domain-containing protein, partial [Eubacteriales bacterium]|nr:Ig-like domain-containing protein [Eubacteriales bacterium]